MTDFDPTAEGTIVVHQRSEPDAVIHVGIVEPGQQGLKFPLVWFVDYRCIPYTRRCAARLLRPPDTP